MLVDRPDVRGREQILKVHVAKVKLDESVNLKEIARITPGFVGADLANLVNEAALLAARTGKPAVTMLEFNEGVERVVAGLEKRQRVMHPDEKQRTAYHESGHALVTYSLPNTDQVHKVSIIPRGPTALGYTMHRPEGDRYTITQTELESRIQSLLAGTVAEELIFGDVATGAQNDLERATEIARSMVMEFGMSRLGRVNYRERARSAYLLGADDVRDRNHSEQTAREIDQEIKRIIEESLEKTRHILQYPPQGAGGRGRTSDREGSHRHGGAPRDYRGQFAECDDCARHHGSRGAASARRAARGGNRSKKAEKQVTLLWGVWAPAATAFPLTVPTVRR